ncbi:MAG TPA: alpha/beta hydrolase-fold protein [Steroidobacteraceae bacterium]|nr:alpha/beta hydrolase-fold protein [Steroidobacteraceae bacterium]
MQQRAALILAFLCLFSAGPSVQAADCKSTVNGDLRIHALTSKIFNNTRSIRVLLPPGYDAPANRDKRYPVLYLLDGQNLFDACLSEVSHAEWQVDETVYRLIREKAIPEMIVVGVDHMGEKRAYEFLPYRDTFGNPDMEEPAGKRFPDFLATEVLPFVDKQYRTLTGHDNTGIGGSSYGGVATLFALMARPQTFGYGLMESPTIWVGMGQLIRDTSPLVAYPNKVFMGLGKPEMGEGENAKKGLALFDTVVANFRAAGYDESTFRYVLEDDAKHTESAWARRLPDALKFLFGDWKQQPDP